MNLLRVFKKKLLSEQCTQFSKIDDAGCLVKKATWSKLGLLVYCPRKHVRLTAGGLHAPFGMWPTSQEFDMLVRVCVCVGGEGVQVAEGCYQRVLIIYSHQ